MVREESPTPVRLLELDDPRASSDEEMTGPISMDPSVPAAGERRPCLVVLAGPCIGEVLPLTDGTTVVIGRDEGAGLRLTEEGVSRRHARLVFSGGAAQLSDLGSTNGTWVGGARITTRELRDGEKIRIGPTTIIKFTYQDPIEEACQRQLLEAALRDGLTGVFNRRYLLQRLAAEIAFADRHRVPVSLLLLDIDHFKVVNDMLGHVAGDSVLSLVSGIVQAKIRLDDVLARYGGEEFAVIARDTSLEGAIRLGERLRTGVAEASFEHRGRPIEVRVSVGVGALPHPEVRDVPSFIALADRALYRAKREGRNRVAA